MIKRMIKQKQMKHNDIKNGKAETNETNEKGHEKKPKKTTKKKNENEK